MPDHSTPRVRLLVSVRDAAEAALARDAGADLIDAKDPDRGALGALSPDTVRAIAAASGDRLTSAVAGEPQDGCAASACLAALAGTGVCYLKIAWAPGRDATGLVLPAGLPVIAVLFAEDGPECADVPALAAVGFSGAMIDTRGKDGRRLTDHLALPRLAGFAAACRAHGLLSGLAGSLALDDIPALAALGPGYLGFRGGLCAQGNRKGHLDPARIAEAVRRLGAVVPCTEAA